MSENVQLPSDGASPLAPTVWKEEAYSARVLVSAENERIQVLSYDFGDAVAFVSDLVERARTRGLGKIWLKARAEDARPLSQAGMIEEAVIRGYFDGRDAHILSYFVDAGRLKRPYLEQQSRIIEEIQASAPDVALAALPPGYELFVAAESDLVELAELYGAVFDSYPYPIDEEGYLLETLRSNVVYAIVRDGQGRLVAAASGETVPELRASEMTDFATLPDQRRKGLAQQLLGTLEKEMARRGITNLYTIARARSRGMNQTFYNARYELTGTLVNNCHISGGFEDMHVWCKTLERVAS